MIAEKESWVNVGVLRAPHGLKGGIKAKIDLDDPMLLQSAGPIRLGDGRTFKVQGLKAVGQGLIALQLEGITTPEQAETFRNTPIFLNRDAFPEDEDEIYLDTLVGEPVLGAENQPVGTIKGVLDLPAGPAFEVQLTPEQLTDPEAKVEPATAIVPVDEEFWTSLTPPTLTPLGESLLFL
jgi:16S rRNA processing protein RimM